MLALAAHKHLEIHSVEVGSDQPTETSWQRRAYVISSSDARSLNEEELKRLTKEDLVRLARNEALPHRSKMNKAQLARTLTRHYRRKAK